MGKPTNLSSIFEAKKYVQENFEEGTECPCCGQFVKLCKRKLNSAMAIALFEIHRENKRNNFEFFHVENHFKTLQNLPASIRGDFPKLRHWNLIQQQDSERDDGSKRNGFYRITGVGTTFIEGNLQVFSHVHLFNDKIQGFSSETVGFRECLGKKFNYDELMRG